MDSYTRFHKTGKGAAEIEDDALQLSTEERQLLILIDGTRTVGDIQLLLPAVSDPASLFRQLLLESLITTGGPAAPAGLAAASSPTGTAWPETPAGIAGSASSAGAFGAAVQTGTVQRPAIPALGQAEAELERLRAVTQVTAPAAPVQSPVAISPVAISPVAVSRSAPETAASPSVPSPAAAVPVVTDNDTNVIDVAEIGLQIEIFKDQILVEAREVFDRDDIDLLEPKIQACQTISELTILATRLRDIVESYADKQTADRFLIRIRKILTA